MKLRIVQTGELVLREPARVVTVEEIRGDRVRQLIEEMRETMREAPGVGLAAPQVGVPLQVAVIEDREEYWQDAPPEQILEKERRAVPFHVIVNPEISPVGDEKAEFYEGCLSVAGFVAVVPRWRRVRVKCLDERGEQQLIEASGWYARILQHEIDHLRGSLYIDRMRNRTFTTVENWTQYWKSKPVTEACQELRAQ